MKNQNQLKNLQNYKVMSIGCGGCPDLMALESYLQSNSISYSSIEYYGIDMNTLWIPIHDEIRNYCSTYNLADVDFEYGDAIQLFNQYYYEEYNILILQYVISHFYNTGQMNEIDSFFDNLIESIVKYKASDEPFIIFINDVNSCYRGRDLFGHLIERLSSYDYSGTYFCYYFDYNIRSEKQRYGKRHRSTSIKYDISPQFDMYEPWRQCSSAQMIIEIKRGEAY